MYGFLLINPNYIQLLKKDLFIEFVQITIAKIAYFHVWLIYKKFCQSLVKKLCKVQTSFRETTTDFHIIQTR